MDKTVGDEESSLKLVPAVVRATQILDCIAESRDGLKLSDLVRQTGLPKAASMAFVRRSLI